MNANNEFSFSLFSTLPSHFNPARDDYYDVKLRTYLECGMRERYPDEPEAKVKVLQEIYDTERAYVIHLTMVDQLFVPQLTDSKTMSAKDLKQLFGDISSICRTNQALLESLRQKSVAEAFLTLLPYLKLYAAYSSRYPESLQAYASLLNRENARNALSLIESDQRVKGMKLHDLLIMPVQRISRYLMLIKKLMSLSTDPEDMSNLHKVSAEMRWLSNHMQISMAAYENGQELLKVQESFGLTKHIFVPGRHLIRDGSLFKRDKEGIFNERVFFLFTDVLLYGKQRLSVVGRKYDPSAMLALRHMTISHNSVEGSINIRCGEARLVITAETFKAVKEWYAVISEAIENAKLLRKTLRKESFDGKVYFFENNFWKRRRDNFRSLVNSDVAATVERVFSSRRRPVQQLDESTFLNGNWTKSRKRKMEIDFPSAHVTSPKKRADNEPCTLYVKRRSPKQMESVHTKPLKVVETPILGYSETEGVDEEDRRPRSFGEERKNLATKEIKKLSNPIHCEMENLFDLNTSMESQRTEKTKEAPWWLAESVPTVIENQRAGFMSSVRSNCSIM